MHPLIAWYLHIFHHCVFGVVWTIEIGTATGALEKGWYGRRDSERSDFTPNSNVRSQEEDAEGPTLSPPDVDELSEVGKAMVSPGLAFIVKLYLINLNREW